MNKGVFISFLFALIGAFFFQKSFSQTLYLTSNKIRDTYPECFDIKRTECDHAIPNFSFIGRIDSALYYQDLEYHRIQPDNDSSLALFEKMGVMDALSYIRENIRDKKVVMLNEQHFYPPNRIFTASLLGDLKKAGFTYLGCEGISRKGDMERDGHPSVSTGFYIEEPQYANLLRVAISLGFKIFSYESHTSGLDERERGQASNIYEIIKADSSARIVIHSGLGHMKKDTAVMKLMGYYFKEISGIDAYTINQAQWMEHSEGKFEFPLYKKVASRLSVPSILFDSSTNKIWKDSHSDVSVFMPRTKYIDGRAGWLNNSYLLPYTLTLPSQTTFPALITVYKKDENEPYYPLAVDAVELSNFQTQIKVYVPLPGEYVVFINGVKQGNISVNN
jgi:hypothetical protein